MTAVSVSVTTVWSGPDAPRAQDAPITQRRPDPVTWNDNLLAEPPSALHGRTVTQALLGEPVLVVDERDGWLEVVLPWQPSSADPRGYPGWIPAAHVDDSADGDGAAAVVTAPTVSAGGVSLSYGSVLPVADRASGSVSLTLPGGGRATVPAADVCALPGPSVTPDAAVMIQSARQFLGMRYLWGGTGGWGFDCSGFVHLVHRRFGRTVPRDAFDQIEAAEPVTLDAAGRGHLYFFGPPGGHITHVGFATNEPSGPFRMLHAPDGGGAQLIEDEPLSPERRQKLAAAGTFLAR